MSKTRSYSFIFSSYCVLMAVAAFIGLSSFLNLKDEEDRQNKYSVHRSMMYSQSLVDFFKQIRCGLIIGILFLLFLGEEEDED